MNPSRIHTVLAVGLAIGSFHAAVPAKAASPPPSAVEAREASPYRDITVADHRFLQQAINDSLAGIALGKLGQQHGSASLQPYARTLEQQHKQTLTALVALSPEHRQRDEVARLDEASDAALDELDALGRANDAGFDRRLLDEATERQQRLLASFRRVVDDRAYSPPVRTLVQQMLPSAQQQLAATGELRQQVQVAAASDED